MNYRLWYWPGFPGRGEFIRLPLEAAGIGYLDCGIARGEDAVIEHLEHGRGQPAFAVPVLEVGDERMAQVANILAYLGARHGFAPDDERQRRFVNQLQLTIADMVEEVHRTHHPVSASLYYEEQKAEALRTARAFREDRIPRYFDYFEDIARANRSGWLVGDRWSYADTSLHFLVDGLAHAFPKRMAQLGPEYPAVRAIRDRIAALEGIVAYYAAGRRQPFGEGIFRFYPELDGAVEDALIT